MPLSSRSSMAAWNGVQPVLSCQRVAPDTASIVGHPGEGHDGGGERDPVRRAQLQEQLLSQRCGRGGRPHRDQVDRWRIVFHTWEALGSTGWPQHLGREACILSFAHPVGPAPLGWMTRSRAERQRSCLRSASKSRLAKPASGGGNDRRSQRTPAMACDPCLRALPARKTTTSSASTTAEMSTGPTRGDA